MVKKLVKKNEKKNVGGEKEEKIAMVVYRKLDELKKLPNNPRVIKDEEFKRLCDSIKRNPKHLEGRPLLLSDRTGELIILGGNQRFEAAKKLGLKEVPTFLFKDLTEAQEREIVIRDNVADGEWNYDLLANQWAASELDEWGVDVPDAWEDEEESGEAGEETIEAEITIKCTKKEKDDIIDWLNIEFKKTAFKNIIIE